MRFIIKYNQSPVNGNLTYNSNHYSFRFETQVCSGISSLLVNNLQLEVDANGQILWTYGLCPHTTWQEFVLLPPKFEQGALFVVLEHAITPGVSMQINKADIWPAYIDFHKGWLKIGKEENFTNQVSVEFATDCIATVSNGSLKAIWLHLAHLPALYK